MDAYTTIPTTFAGYATNGSRLRTETALEFQKRARMAIPASVSQDQEGSTKQALPAPSRKVPDLENLYINIDPAMTMEEYLESKPQPKKTTRTTKPRFQLEMHWTDENFRDKTCRLHNACLESDGSLLVHPWMKSQERHLRACGAKRLKYMKSEADYQKDGVNDDTDLIGVEPSRYHIPHFLTDILPMIYSSELLRPLFTKPALIKSVCEEPGNRRCKRQAIQEQLNPSLYADRRISAMPVSAWVPQLVALLPGGPRMHFERKMLNNSSKPTCFRSIVAYNKHGYSMQGRYWFGEMNPMFREHGISRGSAKSDKGLEENKKTQGCKKKMTILNRVGWEKRANFLLGRDIVNVDQVVDQIERISRFKENENLDLSISIEYFENMSFAEQVDVMQKADVLLGVHGAGLGNMLFARQDVPILEVLPFAYYAGPFDSVAGTLNLDYSSTIAEPDTENFKDCIQLRADKLERPEISTNGMKLWDEAVKKRREGNWYHLLAHRFTRSDLVPVKLCARTQRMKVNPLETAKKLVEMAQVVCGNVPDRKS